MADPRSEKIRGNSLIELVISVGILSLLGSGLFGMIGDSDAVLQTSLRGTKARRDTLDSFEALHADLRQASLQSLSIDHGPTHGDRLRYQVPLGLYGTTPIWGAVQVLNGKRYEHVDHFVVFEVVQNQDGSRDLIRCVQDSEGVTVGQPQVLAENVDAVDSQGLKGFRAQLQDRLLTVSMRVISPRKPGDEDSPLYRTHSSRLRVRNP